MNYGFGILIMCIFIYKVVEQQTLNEFGNYLFGWYSVKGDGSSCCCSYWFSSKCCMDTELEVDVVLGAIFKMMRFAASIECIAMRRSTGLVLKLKPTKSWWCYDSRLKALNHKCIQSNNYEKCLNILKSQQELVIKNQIPARMQYAWYLVWPWKLSPCPPPVVQCREKCLPLLSAQFSSCDCDVMHLISVARSPPTHWVMIMNRGMYSVCPKYLVAGMQFCYWLYDIIEFSCLPPHQASFHGKRSRPNMKLYSVYW